MSADLASFTDPALTKTGGLSWDAWRAALLSEMQRHGNPIGPIEDDEAWRAYYDDDYTPHSAIEEDFNNA